MARASETRDIVVAGGSAGALEALRILLAGLPENLPAAVLIVLHIGGKSYLASILDRHSPLPVVPAESGARLEHGRVHVGVPGARICWCTTTISCCGAVLARTSRGRQSMRCFAGPPPAGAEDALVPSMPRNALRHVDVDESGRSPRWVLCLQG